MRAYWVSCVAILIVGAGGYFFVNAMQAPTGLAYTTDDARVSTNWVWRQVPSSGTVNGQAEPTAGECDKRKVWQWIFVDLGTPNGEPAVCWVSQ